MTMQEYLEREKESLLTDLAAAGTQEGAADVILPRLDRILCQYNEECTDARQRLLASQLMKTAGMALGLMDTAGESLVWEQAAGAQGAGGMGKQSRLLLIGGAACTIAGALLSALSGVVSLPAALSGYLVILILVGAGLLYLSGRKNKRARKTSASGEQARLRVETRIDPEKTYRALRALVLEMDQILKKAGEKGLPAARQRALTGTATGSDARAQDWGGISLDLLSELLEASYSGDGVIALEKLEDLKYALHGQGIRLIDYSQETKAYFDLISGAREATIRPAILQGSQVIRRGLAAGGV